MSDINFLGQHGGQLSMAFGAGCVACFGFCLLIGRWLWAVIGKVKDDQIASLKRTIEENEERCAAMETRLVARIQNLEGLLIMTSPGHFRNQVQQSISELRLDEETRP